MAQSYSFHDPESMLSVANDEDKVARADTKPIYTEDENGDIATWDGGSLAELDGHVAVFNPNNGEIFDVATGSYEPIQPPTFIGPLAGELNERDRSFSGTYRMYNGGGRGYLEVVLEDGGIWPVDREGYQDPVRTGLTAFWSHDGGVSVKARAFAQDGVCSNTMRNVSDAVYVKHAGDVDGRVDWDDEWASLLDNLGAFSETLEEVIDGACEHTLFDLATDEPYGDFSDIADDFDVDDWTDATDGLRKLDNTEAPPGLSEYDKRAINGLYDLLDFPGYICYSATRRMFHRLQNASDAGGFETITAWDAYSALTYALTHEGRFDSGSSSERDYHRTASDLLTNPMLAMEEAQTELRRRLAPDEDETDVGIDSDLGDAVRKYKEREQQMREAIAQDD